MNAEVTSRGWAQVFRGWILQAVGACTLEARRGPVGRALSVVFRTPWPAIVISAALFAGMVDYGGDGFNLFVFAVVTGWVAVRTGGLEASIALAVVYLVGVGLRTDDGHDVAWRHVVGIRRCAGFRGRFSVASPASAHPDSQCRPATQTARNFCLKSAQKSARRRSYL